MNSFSFTLSGKHFICPSILNDSFAAQSNVDYMSLIFITLNTSCQSLLACKVSFGKSANSIMGILLQVTNFLLLLLGFSIFNFGILIIMCLGVGLLSGTLCFQDLHVYLLHQIREVFFHYSFQQISKFLLFLFFCHPCDANVGPLEAVPETANSIHICLDSVFFLLF